MDHHSWNQNAIFESLKGTSNHFSMHSSTTKVLIRRNDMSRLLQTQVRSHELDMKQAIADIRRTRQQELQHIRKVIKDIIHIKQKTKARHHFLKESTYR